MPTWNDLYPQNYGVGFSGGGDSYFGGSTLNEIEPWRQKLRGQQLQPDELLPEAMYQRDKLAQDMIAKAQIADINAQAQFLKTFQNNPGAISRIYSQPTDAGQAELNRILGAYASNQERTLQTGLKTYPTRLKQYYDQQDRARQIRNDAFSQGRSRAQLALTARKQAQDAALASRKFGLDVNKAAGLTAYRNQRLNDQRNRDAAAARDRDEARRMTMGQQASNDYDQNVKAAIDAVRIDGMDPDTAADLFGVDDNGRAVLYGYGDTIDSQDSAMMDALNRKITAQRMRNPTVAGDVQDALLIGNDPNDVLPPLAPRDQQEFLDALIQSDRAKRLSLTPEGVVRAPRPAPAARPRQSAMFESPDGLPVVRTNADLAQVPRGTWWWGMDRKKHYKP